MRQIRFIAVITFVFLFSSFVCAQATRTWVSGVGDDVNPCSRTAPCKTFAGSISKTAAGGEINCLDPGGFGTVTITKSMTIDCKGMTGGILASGVGTIGITINGAAAIVRLRGVNINGAGSGSSGIKISAAAKVFIEDTVIDGFIMPGVWVENSGDVKIVISNATLRNNSEGIYSNPKGTSDIFVINSLVSGNSDGIRVDNNATIRVSGCSIVFNGLSFVWKGTTGKIISYQNNLIDGNLQNTAPTSTAVLK